MAAQGHSEGQSVNRPPLFDGEDYAYRKTRMEYFLQGHDHQIWSIVEEGDLLVTNEKNQWTDDDRKKISLNCKAKSILCCALSKKEFNRVSACKSAMEIWEKLRITYEGTDKVKDTKIDIPAIPYRPQHRLPSDLKPSTSPARNFLRGSSSITLPVLQNLSLLDSMASTTVSGTVGGYGAAFLTVDQQARFASVKAKLCGHKAVDLADLEKNGMGSLVEALQKLKWTKIATLSEIIVPRSASFSTCARADSDMMFWAIQNQEYNTAELIIERMKFASSQVWDTKSKLNISLPYAHLLTRIFQHFGISVVGDVSEKMGQAIRSRNLRKSGFSVVNGVWSKTGAVEGEAIIGEAQEDLEPVAEAAAVVEPEAAAIDQVVPAAAVPAVAEEEGSRRIEDIPPDFIEPFG
ncbi:hypothetical protein Taro_044708 [Colocasia esculenta]|uniref:Uncharacterized protein n=1 Tax=Colocasia esculenta TaxID=4460 RepID=A0A843WV85_COLES|nr:hypothetical protein [Colocasia esculenta]